MPLTDGPYHATVPIPSAIADPQRKSAMHEPKTIMIQNHEFTVPYRYAEGHVLNASEAKALNQSYHGNLRNNFAGMVRTKLQKVYGNTPPPKDARLEAHHIDELQNRLTSYAEEYEFTGRGHGPKPQDPIEIEAYRMALAAVRRTVRGTAYTTEWVQAKVQHQLKTDPDYRKAAAAVVAARMAISAKRLMVEEK
jgi:hypothetical protein